MTLCPIALAVHCESCPIVKVCPAKTIIGDFKESPKLAEQKAPRSKKKKR